MASKMSVLLEKLFSAAGNEAFTATKNVKKEHHINHFLIDKLVSNTIIALGLNLPQLHL